MWGDIARDLCSHKETSDSKGAVVYVVLFNISVNMYTLCREEGIWNVITVGLKLYYGLRASKSQVLICAVKHGYMVYGLSV